MILRRLALFVAIVFAFLATQVPEFIQQYRQGLGRSRGRARRGSRTFR